MIEAGANPKDGQGQMRHSRITTRMDIYAQHVPCLLYTSLAIKSKNRPIYNMAGKLS